LQTNRSTLQDATTHIFVFTILVAPRVGSRIAVPPRGKAEQISQTLLSISQTLLSAGPELLKN